MKQAPLNLIATTILIGIAFIFGVNLKFMLLLLLILLLLDGCCLVFIQQKISSKPIEFDYDHNGRCKHKQI